MKVYIAQLRRDGGRRRVLLAGDRVLWGVPVEHCELLSALLSVPMGSVVGMSILESVIRRNAHKRLKETDLSKAVRARICRLRKELLPHGFGIEVHRHLGYSVVNIDYEKLRAA